VIGSLEQMYARNKSNVVLMQKFIEERKSFDTSNFDKII
jgi:hypothetical protein